MYTKWEKPDLNQRARASINFVDWCLVFQRNVTYSVHCKRHVLSAVNFHNRHTDDDGCIVETCLLKFTKSRYF